ncbi:MAG: DNA repair protein RecO [Myxococcota bacterium]
MSAHSTSPAAICVQQDDAIVTSLVRYAESDCIVRLLCRRLGCVHAFVPRGLRPGRRNASSSLQAPAKAKVAIRLSRNQSLARVVRAELVASTCLLSRTVRSFAHACYITELTEALLPPDESATPFFTTANAALHQITQGDERDCLLRAFELKLLHFCGELPNLQQVADQPGLPAVAYHPQRGQLLAKGCPQAMPFGPSAVAASTSLLQARLRERPTICKPLLRQIEQMLASRLQQCLTKPLRSTLFLRQLPP